MTLHEQIRTALSKCSDLSPLQFQWLKSHGVDAFSLAAPWAVSTAEVAFDETGLFNFSDEIEGDQIFESALIFPESDTDGLLIDLVAYAPKTKRAASWLGRVGSCGNIGQARLGADSGLLVHRCPLRWLAHAREGIWLFDTSAAVAFGLADHGPFAVGSVAEKHWLANALVPPRPTIHVRTNGRASA